MMVWIYVDTSKQVGDKDHLKVFGDEATADAWFADHDPEGVAFEYEVSRRSAGAGQPLRSASRAWIEAKNPISPAMNRAKDMF